VYDLKRAWRAYAQRRDDWVFTEERLVIGVVAHRRGAVLRFVAAVDLDQLITVSVIG